MKSLLATDHPSWYAADDNILVIEGSTLGKPLAGKCLQESFAKPGLLLFKESFA
jgi:hypothetical protein